MKKDFEDKVRELTERHNKNLTDKEKVKEINVKVVQRIGFGNKQQIIVNCYT